jgi:hypothetical protein
VSGAKDHRPALDRLARHAAKIVEHAKGADVFAAPPLNDG